MELEDEIMLDDDADIPDIFEFFNEMDEMSFFRRFRLKKDTVLSLLEQIEDQLEIDNDLNNTVSPINQLLITLRFYGCNSYQNCIGDFINIDQTIASRIIKKVTQVIAGLSKYYFNMAIGTERTQIKNEFYRIAQFPRVLGCIDGTHVKIERPIGDLATNNVESFRNRKSYFSINTQLVASPNLKIMNIVARWPGAADDCTVLNNSRLKVRFEQGEFQNGVLLGDSNFQVKPYLLTPLANPNTRAENLYNESLIRTRNVVERTVGLWKRRFPVLVYGIRGEINTTLAMIVATTVLHNIAIDMNEDEPPPPPDEINLEELNDLIMQGEIPNAPGINTAIDRAGDDSVRQNLINNYFNNLIPDAPKENIAINREGDDSVRQKLINSYFSNM